MWSRCQRQRYPHQWSPTAWSWTSSWTSSSPPSRCFQCKAFNLWQESSPLEEETEAWSRAFVYAPCLFAVNPKHFSASSIHQSFIYLCYDKTDGCESWNQLHCNLFCIDFNNSITIFSFTIIIFNTIIVIVFWQMKTCPSEPLDLNTTSNKPSAKHYTSYRYTLHQQSNKQLKEGELECRSLSISRSQIKTLVPRDPHSTFLTSVIMLVIRNDRWRWDDNALQ